MRWSAAQRSATHPGVRVTGHPWFADCSVLTACPFFGARVLSSRSKPPSTESGVTRLTYPDPDEQQRDSPAARGRSKDRAEGDPGDTDTAFDRIVAGLRDELEPPCPALDPAPEAARNSGEDHFDPPEPPPFPTPRPRTVGGVLTLTVGMLLLLGPSLLGLGEHVATPLGLLALTAGIGWLVIGLRPDPPPERSDDGAQL